MNRFKKLLTTVVLPLSLLTGAAAEAGSSAELVQASLNHSDRSSEDVAEDGRRMPLEVLAFASIEEGMTVLEMEAGSGYFTEILSRTVGNSGSVIMQNPPAFDGFAAEPIAAQRLADEYFLSYLRDDSLTSMEAVAETPLWKGYMERNSAGLQKIFMEQNIDDFRATMKMTGEYLASFHAKTTLGMTDEQLMSLEVPATLILHHGQEIDFLHPKVNARAATTLIQNSTFKITPSLQSIVDEVLPFVREYTSVMEAAH